MCTKWDQSDNTEHNKQSTTEQCPAPTVKTIHNATGNQPQFVTDKMVNNNKSGHHPGAEQRITTVFRFLIYEIFLRCDELQLFRS